MKIAYSQRNKSNFALLDENENNRGHKIPETNVIMKVILVSTKFY